MQNQHSRITGRNGLNAARAFFERYGYTFQEVGQQQDFGKDAYVDIAEDGKITHLCVALQVKAGTSYRTRGGDYAVPVEDHADLWRRSTVPVFGIVYDPDDEKLRWVDLTGYLRAHPDQTRGRISVSSRQTVDYLSLRGAFTNAVTAYTVRGAGDLTLNLLSPDPFQTAAVYDAWALSRSDGKYLLIVRRFLMDLQKKPLQRAIFLLSHAGENDAEKWPTLME